MLGGQRLQGLWGGDGRPRGRHSSVPAALAVTLPRGPVLSWRSLTQPAHRASTRRLFSCREARACDPVVSQAWAPSRGCRSHPCPDFASLLPHLRLLFCLKSPSFPLVGTLAAGLRATWTARVIPPSKDPSRHSCHEVPSRGRVGEDIRGPSTGPGTESVLGSATEDEEGGSCIGTVVTQAGGW